MTLWPPASILPSPVMLSTFSRCGQGAALAAAAAPAPVSGAIGAAAAFLYPLTIDDPITVVKAFVMNGATVGGNFDIGLYDKDYNRIVSTGSVAQVGTNVLQEATIAATTLDVGRYHLAFSLDSATATYFSSTTAFARTAGAHAQVNAGAFPLPAAFVSTQSVDGTIVFGFSARSLVA